MNEEEFPDAAPQGMSRGVVPAKSNGFITHSCLAVFEMIEAGLLSATMDPSIHVKLIEQEDLVLNTCSEDVTAHGMFKHMASGPIMFRSSEVGEGIRSLPAPSWWAECTAQLEKSCHGSIPKGSTFSSYAPWL